MGTETDRMWSQTGQAMGHLQQLLGCGSCHAAAQDPQTLSQCGHLFCRSCIEAQLETTASCPTCFVPAWTSHLQPCNRAASLLAALTQLQSALAGHEPTAEPSSPEPVPAQRRALSEGFSSLPQRPPHTPASSHSAHQEIFPPGRASVTYGRRQHTGSSASMSAPVSAPTSARTTTPRTPGQRRMQQTTLLSHMAPRTAPTPSAAPRRVTQRPSPRQTTGNTAPAPPSTEKKAKVPTNHLGETPLHIAAKKGNVARVTELLSEGRIPVDTRDNAGWTPLHEACNKGSVEVVGLLLDAGANVNAPGFDNNTPLHDATHVGHLDVVALLLQRGANREAINRAGLRPIDLSERDEIAALINDFTLAPKPMPQQTLPTTASTGEGAAGSKVVAGEVVMLLTGLDKTQKAHAVEWASRIPGVLLVTRMDDAVTHVVVETNSEGRARRTMKYLQGLLLGKTLASLEWLKECASMRQLLPVTPFLVVGDTFALGGPHKAAMAHRAQEAPLFHECAFFFRGTFVGHPLNELRRLVRIGGGRDLQKEPKNPVGRDGRRCLIVEEVGGERGEGGVDVVGVEWLLDCMSHYTILDTNPV